MRWNNWRELKTAQIAFDSQIRSALRYPAIDSNEHRFWKVDPEFFVDVDWRACEIQVAERPVDRPRTYYPKVEYRWTWDSRFVGSAIEMVDTFRCWQPYRLDGKIVIQRRYQSVYFSYHREYFNDQQDFEINPDRKPQFPHATDRYRGLILNEFGCDGIANVLCIVEKDGTLTNFECLGNEGKTSCRVARELLLQLGRWEPAQHKSRAIRSQLDLLVHT